VRKILALLILSSKQFPSRQLKKDGCTTEVANNGLQAIEKILALVRKVPGLDTGPDHFDAVLVSTRFRTTQC
jgi:hypothetical protein